MAVFPLENGVFSGTLLRFNVRGYVYIWSLIFSMFKFFVCACSWVLIMHLFGGMGDGLLNGLMGETGV